METDGRFDHKNELSGESQGACKRNQETAAVSHSNRFTPCHKKL